MNHARLNPFTHLADDTRCWPTYIKRRTRALLWVPHRFCSICPIAAPVMQRVHGQVGEKWLLTYSYRGIVIANAARRSRRRLPHFHPLRLRPSIAKREKGTVSLVLGFRFRWIPRF
ncbi:hypothetical protein BHM03_00002699 [Ensete ventricosum]|nr:hypothetical protein BHM03_00002699 [Ensete ventricosum]